MRATLERWIEETGDKGQFPEEESSRRGALKERKKKRGGATPLAKPTPAP